MAKGKGSNGGTTGKEFVSENAFGSVVLSEKEKNLVSLLGQFPEKVREASEQFSPHKISFYLLALSQEFNSFYHEAPVLQANPEERRARLAIVNAAMRVIENGLGLLNINTVNEM